MSENESNNAPRRSAVARKARFAAAAVALCAAAIGIWQGVPAAVKGMERRAVANVAKEYRRDADLFEQELEGIKARFAERDQTEEQDAAATAPDEDEVRHEVVLTKDFGLRKPRRPRRSGKP